MALALCGWRHSVRFATEAQQEGQLIGDLRQIIKHSHNKSSQANLLQLIGDNLTEVLVGCQR